ncbi:unnamed protein product, partial [Choristocarpus tenellus]
MNDQESEKKISEGRRRKLVHPLASTSISAPKIDFRGVVEGRERFSERCKRRTDPEQYDCDNFNTVKRPRQLGDDVVCIPPTMR